MRSVSLLCTLLAVTSPFVSSIPALRADSELAAHQTQSDGAPRVPLQKKGDLVPNHFHGTGSPSNGSRTYVEPRKQTTTSASSSGQMLTQGSNPDLQSLSQRFFLRTGVLYALTMVQDGGGSWCWLLQRTTFAAIQCLMRCFSPSNHHWCQLYYSERPSGRHGATVQHL